MYEVANEIRDIIAAACTTQFKKYYVGKIRYPFKMDLPCLSVYGISTNLESQLSTAKDKYTFEIKIDVFSPVYKYVATTGTETTDVLLAQKAVYELMEKRTDGIPDANTVLGSLRRLAYLRGTNFLFTNNITIDYTEELIEGSAYYKGTMTLNATTTFNTRV